MKKKCHTQHHTDCDFIVSFRSIASAIGAATVNVNAIVVVVVVDISCRVLFAQSEYLSVPS